MRSLKLAVSLTLVIALTWFWAAHEKQIHASVASRDSIQYWATGKLLLNRHNPYSVQDVEALERTAGYASDRPLMFRCPPWALWLVVVPGLLSPFWAWVVWLANLLAALAISMRLSWRMFGHGTHPPASFVVAGYMFAPVLACLVAGQVGMFLLLGVALFLAYEDDRPFWAGAALIIPMAKPHIFALVWPVLAIWAVSRKKWSLIGGFTTAFAIALVVAFAFDPGVVQHYRGMLQQQEIHKEFIPALSGMIRALFFRRIFFVQFVPLILGLLWTAWFYWKHRAQWNWRTRGLLVLVVAVLTTPYAWMTDEVVLLPAILQGVLWLCRAKLKVQSHLAILLFICLDLLLLLIVKAQVPPATGIYFWSSLVWFSWYWYAKRFAPPRVEISLPS